VYGDQDESVAAVLQYMGTLEFRANELDKALQLLNEFVRIRQENNTEKDGDYVNVLFMIGNIHKMQGREDLAQKCWTEAYEVFQDLGLAEGNPQITQIMNTIMRNSDNGEMPEHFQERFKQPKGPGMLGRLTEKMKGTLRDDKMSLNRGRNKNRGHKLKM
jgi:tetratricopeptide (TPR) repeat protein